jgi:hypothetical protein
MSHLSALPEFSAIVYLVSSVPSLAQRCNGFKKLAQYMTDLYVLLCVIYPPQFLVRDLPMSTLLR